MLLWWTWMHLKCTVKICLSPPFRSENEFSSWVSANLRSTPHFWNVSEDTGRVLWAEGSEDPELTARILVVRFINHKRLQLGLRFDYFDCSCCQRTLLGIFINSDIISIQLIKYCENLVHFLGKKSQVCFWYKLDSEDFLLVCLRSYSSHSNT